MHCKGSFTMDAETGCNLAASSRKMLKYCTALFTVMMMNSAFLHFRGKE